MIFTSSRAPNIPKHVGTTTVDGRANLGTRVLAVLLLPLVLLVSCAKGKTSTGATATTTPSSSTTVATTPTTTATTLAASTAVGASKPAGSIEIDMANFAFVPDTVTAKAGDVVFFIANHEQQPVTDASYRHNLIIPGPTVNGLPSNPIATSGDFRPGESGTFTVKNLPPGTYTFFCSYHRSMQMNGTLTVLP